VELNPGGDVEIWQSFAQRTARGVPFLPPPGETLFRYIILPPPDDALSGGEWENIAENFFAANAIENYSGDPSRHTMMHATPTADCMVLLQGRAQLLLDTGEPVELRPLDVLRQSGTNHCWVNLGPGPAIFLTLMHAHAGPSNLK